MKKNVRNHIDTDMLYYEMTSLACPEQYDVWDKNVPDNENYKKIAYIRYRGGLLSVNPYKENDEIDFDTFIYSKYLTDDIYDGYLGLNENKEIFDMLNNLILNFIKNK